ncbi:MAG TPA: CPBP family intramembrane glutamic endopeptidase [Myxococcota bacterium]|nr:CPBP family intramembrane glutamic endopeptidase [Myxococcota bacterium]
MRLSGFREDLPALKRFWSACTSQEGLVLLFATVIFVTRRTVHQARWTADLLEAISPILADSEIRLRIGGVVFWGLVPLLLVLLVHRKSLLDFGLRLPKARWFVFSIVYLVVVHPVNFAYAQSPEILERYPLYEPARDGGTDFWIYQALVAAAMVGWEFLLRGYMLFGLEKRLGALAIFVPLIPFVMLHYGYPTPELYFSILDGIFLSLLAWVSRSIWPCVVIHILQNLLWEIEVVYLF